MREIIVLVSLLWSAIARAQMSRPPISTDTIRSWIRLYQPTLLSDDTSNVVVFFVGPDGRVKRSAAGRDYRVHTREVRAAAMRELYRTRGNPVVAGPDSLLPVEEEPFWSGRRGLLDTLPIATPMTLAIVSNRGIPEWPHEVLVVFLK
jgi:hypothetical protein